MLINEWILNNKISGIKFIFSLYASRSFDCWNGCRTQKLMQMVTEVDFEDDTNCVGTDKSAAVLMLARMLRLWEVRGLNLGMYFECSENFFSFPQYDAWNQIGIVSFNMFFNGLFFRFLWSSNDKQRGTSVKVVVVQLMKFYDALLRCDLLSFSTSLLNEERQIIWRRNISRRLFCQWVFRD